MTEPLHDLLKGAAPEPRRQVDIADLDRRAAHSRTRQALVGLSAALVVATAVSIGLTQIGGDEDRRVDTAGSGGLTSSEVSDDDAPGTPTVQPGAVEACGEAITTSADVSVSAGAFVTVRLVPTESDLNSEDIQHIRMSETMSPLRLDLFVGPAYSEDRDAPPQRESSPGVVLGTPVTPMRGEHVVTVEMDDKVVAKGSVTVLPEDPETPTRCHSGAN